MTAHVSDTSTARVMTFMDHVRELRTRLFVVAIVFIAGATLAYVYRDWLVHFLLSPLGGEKLIYLNPAGGFSFVFLISAYAGLALAIPVAMYQLYRFLRPVLPKKVQAYSVRIFVSSLILLISGAAFGYYFAIPGALHFLYSFAADYVSASLTADSYLGFIIAYTIGLGLVFQLPLLLLLFHWIKPQTPGSLLKSERWVILLSFIAAAIITPTPDPLNQTIIALPIIVTYQIGVFAVLVSIRKSRRAARTASQAIAEPVPLPLPLSDLAPVALAAPAAISKPQTPRRARRPVLDGIIIVPSRGSVKAQPKNLPQPAPVAPSKSQPNYIRYARRASLDGISAVYPRQVA